MIIIINKFLIKITHERTREGYKYEITNFPFVLIVQCSVLSGSFISVFFFFSVLKFHCSLFSLFYIFSILFYRCSLFSCSYFTCTVLSCSVYSWNLYYEVTNRYIPLQRCFLPIFFKHKDIVKVIVSMHIIKWGYILYV